ncbi:transcription factor jumonji, JmjC [Erythrobacter sp. NFXS35]|uniref:JmjC domain-containing protein n=1 Tax=Erythrobacter sp. NFXS35 TaxID=2818436 RepID=UPI0032DE5525
MTLIDPSSLPRLAACYPHAAGRLQHKLAAEPLLSHAALAEAARALPPTHVEKRVHDAEDGAAFRMSGDQRDSADAIAQGGIDAAWIMLRCIEQLPDYRALLHRLLAELAPVITPASGPVRDVKGFAFISAPGTHTPFHFDAEYNILFQIAGDKVFATYPPAPPFVDLDAREAFHVSGANMLGWEPGFAAAGQQHMLAPGDALFVPYAAPHWVHAGDTPSVSLSVTWQTRASRAEADALALNPALRRIGLPYYDPAAAARVPWLRAAASRIGQRVGLL